VAESKIADFAAEAAAQDAGTLRDYDPVKQLELVACLVHTARARARDDLADMLCKRVSVIVKKAKAELDDIRTRQRTVTEKLIAATSRCSSSWARTGRPPRPTMRRPRWHTRRCAPWRAAPPGRPCTGTASLSTRRDSRCSGWRACRVRRW